MRDDHGESARFRRAAWLEAVGRLAWCPDTAERPNIVYFDEWGWRFVSTGAILGVMEQAIGDISARFAEFNGQYETDEGPELMESLPGLALVAAQTYIASTISDTKRIAGGANP